MCGSCKSNWPPGKWGNVEGRKKKEGGEWCHVGVVYNVARALSIFQRIC